MIRALAPALGCGLMMVLAMAAMAAMGRRSAPATDPAEDEVAGLRAELDALRSDHSTNEPRS